MALVARHKLSRSLGLPLKAKSSFGMKMLFASVTLHSCAGRDIFGERAKQHWLTVGAG